MDLDALTRSQRAKYDETLRGTHHRRVEFELYRKRDGAPVTSFTRTFLGGAIHGDQERTPITYLEGDVLDVDGELDWSNGEHRHYEVQVVDHRFIPTLGSRTETVVATNLIPNPSAEVGVSGIGGGAVRDTTRAWVGGASYRTNGDLVATVAGLTPGKTYTASSWVFIPSTVTGTVTPRVGSTAVTPAFNGDPITVRNQWVRASITFTVDADGGSLAFYPALLGTGDRWVDALMLTEGTVSPDYFDGETRDTAEHVYEWTGTPHDSTSRHLLYGPREGEWVSARSFRGPLWTFNRDGAQVHFVAEGPEMHALGSVRRSIERPAKTRATVVVRDLLIAAGALRRNLLIPSLRATLPKKVTVGVKRGKRRDNNGKKEGKGKDDRRKVQVMRVDHEDTYWGQSRRIARALDRDLFADNVGRFVLRSRKLRPKLRVGRRSLLAPVVASRPQEEETTNTWVVTGTDPKGPRKKPVVTVELPKTHPSSAHAQRWNGTPREVTEAIDDDQVKTDRQARRIGRRARDRVVRERVSYEASVLPIVPYIRPYSRASLPLAEGGRASGSVPAWTIPLGPGADPLTLGANRRRGPGLDPRPGKGKPGRGRDRGGR